jgi:hypothetical protein
MSVSLSAGAFCRPGRPPKRRRKAERGVSDPASLASGSAQARRAGSLTPRVGVQIVRRNAARIALRSVLSFVKQMQVTIALAVALSIELATMSYGRLTN